MSMISAQIDELRKLAGDGSMEWVAGPIRASVLREAADTIWELRCRLVDAEDRVRKSGELCKLCEREAENAKLREACAELRMFIDLKQTCWKYVGLCDECPYNGVDDEHDDCNCTVREKVNSLARKLGVEVE